MIRCPECMACVDGKDVCPKCGNSDFSQPQQVPHALPAQFLLQGRYTVGLALGKSRQAICYIGFDEEENAPVLLEEFFPQAVAERKGEAVCPKKQSENYQRATALFAQSKKQGGTGFLRSFAASGTVYRVYGLPSEIDNAEKTAEALLDDPILFHKNGKAEMTINCLPIPPFPAPRGVRKTKSSGKHRWRRRLWLLIPAVLLIAVMIFFVAKRSDGRTLFDTVRMEWLSSSPKEDSLPTEAPSETTSPTMAAVSSPSSMAAEEPTDEPTAAPTDEPVTETAPEPTAEITPEPTDEPTAEPTEEPTEEPTAEPTAEPTEEPTEEPTAEPTEEPTAEPTPEPTEEPTAEPTPEPKTETQNPIAALNSFLRQVKESFQPKESTETPGPDSTPNSTKTPEPTATPLLGIVGATVRDERGVETPVTKNHIIMSKNRKTTIHFRIRYNQEENRFDGNWTFKFDGTDFEPRFESNEWEPDADDFFVTEQDLDVGLINYGNYGEYKIAASRKGLIIGEYYEITVIDAELQTENEKPWPQETSFIYRSEQTPAPTSDPSATPGPSDSPALSETSESTETPVPTETPEPKASEPPQAWIVKVRLPKEIADASCTVVLVSDKEEEVSLPPNGDDPSEFVLTPSDLAVGKWRLAVRYQDGFEISTDPETPVLRIVSEASINMDATEYTTGNRAVCKLTIPGQQEKDEIELKYWPSGKKELAQEVPSQDGEYSISLDAPGEFELECFVNGISCGHTSFVVSPQPTPLPTPILLPTKTPKPTPTQHQKPGSAQPTNTQIPSITQTPPPENTTPAQDTAPPDAPAQPSTGGNEPDNPGSPDAGGDSNNEQNPSQVTGGQENENQQTVQNSTSTETSSQQPQASGETSNPETHKDESPTARTEEGGSAE